LIRVVEADQDQLFEEDIERTVKGLNSALICRVLALAWVAMASSFDYASAAEVWPRSLHPKRVHEFSFEKAYTLMANGRMAEAFRLLRPHAEETAAGSLEVGLLLMVWRHQFLAKRLNSYPPAEWYLDWLRCTTLMQVHGGYRRNQQRAATGLAYFFAKHEFRDEHGGFHFVPGPGGSPELAKCWNEVVEQTVPAQQCIKLEQSWRESRGKLAVPLLCPPEKPTTEDIAAFPSISWE
jgi:hypothetical protein